MAALLCQSLSKLCTECSSCLTLPCRACCDCASQVICSPFTPYLAVTVLFNLPVILFGYGTIQQNDAQCDKVWWLWANAIMAALHIVGSIYIVYRIQQSAKEDDEHLHDYNDMPIATAIATPVASTKGATTTTTPATTGYHSMDQPQAADTINANSPPRSAHSHFVDMFTKVMADQTTNTTTTSRRQQQQPGATVDDDGPANSFHRLSQVLCYDPGVALYFVVAVCWVVWQSIGVTVAISLAAAANNGDDNECENVKEWIFLSTVCGFLYMMVVVCAFGCSLLCLR